MKIDAIVVGVLLSGGIVSASAHTHLEKAVPADGSVITTAPANIVLTFSESARLTALSIQKGSEPSQKISPLPVDAAAEISIPSPKLTPGSYVVTWRVVSDDNHVMSGKLHFTYSGESLADHAAHP